MLPVSLRPGMGAQKSISAPERAGSSTSSLTSPTSKQSAEPHLVQGVASTLAGMDSRPLRSSVVRVVNTARHRGPAESSCGRSTVREEGACRQHSTHEHRSETGCIGGRMLPYLCHGPLSLPQPGGATHTAGISVRRPDERRDDLV